MAQERRQPEREQERVRALEQVLPVEPRELAPGRAWAPEPERARVRKLTQRARVQELTGRAQVQGLTRRARRLLRPEYDQRWR